MTSPADTPGVPRIKSNTGQNFQALRNVLLYGLTEDEIRIVEDSVK